MHAIDGMACAKRGCATRGKLGLNIVGHGSFPTKWGRRWRYRCTVCGGPVSTHTGTAYSGLRCARREFDQVASLRVEGVSLAATARVTGPSRHTIARWLERASTAAKRFNQRLLRDVEIIELPAEELCTFIGTKSRATGWCAASEVWSRWWAGSVLGRRASRNATAVLNDVILRGRVVGFPLIATDGFAYSGGVMERLFGSACVYGHVLKTRRNDRVVRVERRRRIGPAGRLKAALWESEDSETLNTSFVERLNRTIRHGSADVRRRSPCHARGADPRHGHVDRLRCSYNVIRPHRALKCGRETRTPAMQAGWVTAPMNWSDIVTAPAALYAFHVAVVPRSRCRPAHAHEPSRAVIVLVAARTQIGCLINSGWTEDRNRRSAHWVLAPSPDSVSAAERIATAAESTSHAAPAINCGDRAAWVTFLTVSPGSRRDPVLAAARELLQAVPVQD